MRQYSNKEYSTAKTPVEYSAEAIEHQFVCHLTLKLKKGK